eukprot:Sspe_Gene.41697::Locus_20175_Transcript_1_1_Confidence_1.000_Length_814::g.41697::m.41697
MRALPLCLVAAAAAVLWGMWGNRNPTTLGSKALEDKWEEKVDCAEAEYLQAAGCAPKRCGRLATDALLTEERRKALLRMAEKGMGLGKQVGPAAILDLQSGVVSYKEQFISIYNKLAYLKKEGVKFDATNLFTKSHIEIYKDHIRHLRDLVAESFGLEPSSLHLASPSFISRLQGDIPPRNVHDEYW